MTPTVINDIFYFHGGEWASDTSVINVRSLVAGNNGSLLEERHI